MYGGVHAYAATEPKDTANDRNFLVLGPWRHSGVNYDGTTLGPLKLEGNTALQFRREVMQPFLDEHLKDGAAPGAHAAGVRLRDRHQRVAAPAGVAAVVRVRLRLQPAAAVPAGRASRWASRRPAGAPPPSTNTSPILPSPCPTTPRPVHFADGPAWQRWLLNDQRFVADRPDVLSYVSAPLTAPLHIGGAPVVNLFASTQRHRQ